MNGSITVILAGLFTLGGVYLGFWLGEKRDKKKNQWEFYRNATIEVLSVINLVDTDIIRFNLNLAEQFIKHLQKFNEIKISLEILKDEEALNNFKGFYDATIKFSDELRKIKNEEKKLETIDSYKQFESKKEEWFSLIRKRLKAK